MFWEINEPYFCTIINFFCQSSFKQTWLIPIKEFPFSVQEPSRLQVVSDWKPIRTQSGIENSWHCRITLLCQKWHFWICVWCVVLLFSTTNFMCLELGMDRKLELNLEIQQRCVSVCGWDGDTWRDLRWRNYGQKLMNN